MFVARDGLALYCLALMVIPAKFADFFCCWDDIMLFFDSAADFRRLIGFLRSKFPMRCFMDELREKFLSN
jgi:hypothetical protein